MESDYPMDSNFIHKRGGYSSMFVFSGGGLEYHGILNF